MLGSRLLSFLIGGALLEVGILNIKIESAVAMTAPNAHSDNPWTCEPAERTTDLVSGRHLDALFLHRFPTAAVVARDRRQSVLASSS